MIKTGQSISLAFTDNSLQASVAKTEAGQASTDAGLALVTAQDAISKVGEALDTANLALESAGGSGNMNYYGKYTPTDAKEGDLWFKYNDAGVCISMLRWGGSEWVSEVDVSKLSVKELSAISANLGDVTAGNISGATITGSYISSNTGDGYSTSLSGGVLSAKGLITRAFYEWDGNYGGRHSIYADYPSSVEISNGIITMKNTDKILQSTGKSISNGYEKQLYFTPQGITTDLMSFEDAYMADLNDMPINYLDFNATEGADTDLSGIGDIMLSTPNRFMAYGRFSTLIYGGEELELRSPGTLLFSGNVNTTGSLDVTGKTTLKGELEVQKDITVGSSKAYRTTNGAGQEYAYFKSNGLFVSDAGSAVNLYLRPTTSGEVRITTNADSDVYRPLRASGLYANSLECNTGTHLYIRPSGGEVKATESGSTSSYVPVRASNFYDASGNSAYMNGTGGGTLSSSSSLSAGGIVTNSSAFYLGVSTYLHVTNMNGYNGGGSVSYMPIKASSVYANAVECNTGTHLYIRPSSTGEIRVTKAGSTTDYTSIKASAFTNSSSYELKQDISVMNRSALDIVDTVAVYEYRYISDVEDGNSEDWKIGLIAEYSSQVATPDGSGVDVYKMASVNWRATQELYQQAKGDKMAIEMLTAELAEKDEQMIALEARLSTLEALLN